MMHHIVYLSLDSRHNIFKFVLKSFYVIIKCYDLRFTININMQVPILHLNKLSANVEKYLGLQKIITIYIVIIFYESQEPLQYLSIISVD